MPSPARYAAVDTAQLLGERADKIRIGYASRESGGCRSGIGERDCFETVFPFHACCPDNTECQSQFSSAHCCEPDQECTNMLKANPQCANPEHDRYDNDGAFCCEQGMKGYMDPSNNMDGCGDADYVLKGKQKWLKIVESGKPISSKTTASSATNTKSSSHTTTASDSTTTTSSDSSTITSASGSSTTDSNASATAPAPSSSTTAAAGSTTNGGAIAGGVIGALAVLGLIGVLIWYLRRRKARSYAPTTPPSPSGAYQTVDGSGSGGGAEKGVPLAALATKPSHHAQDSVGGASVGGFSELPGKEEGGYKGAAELYSPSVASPVELHGTGRGPGELPAWDARGVPAHARPGEERVAPVELP